MAKTVYSLHFDMMSILSFALSKKIIACQDQLQNDSV